MPPKIPIPRCLLTSSYLLRPQCLTYNSSFHPTSPSFPTFLPTTPHRTYANPPQKKSSSASPKRRPQRTSFRQYPLKDADQYSLSEAMQYLQAFEVGQDPVATKYELAVKLHAMKNGPTIKTRVKLPKPVKTDMKICVIAEGPVAEAALKAGADVAGTTEVFELIKTGKFSFTHVIAHDESYPLLTKARLGQILGPKGLMPSPKMGNVVPNPASAIRELTGKADYRERLGVIRVAVGQLGFTEQELAKNISAFMESIKKEIGILAGKTEKGIVEVVLSTTRGPGFSLNGAIRPSKETEEQPVQAAVATA